MNPKISPRLAPRFHHCRRLFFILFFIRGNNVKQRERVPLGALFICWFWFPVMRSCTDLLLQRSGASARRRSVPVAVKFGVCTAKGHLEQKSRFKTVQNTERRLPVDLCEKPPFLRFFGAFATVVTRPFFPLAFCAVCKKEHPVNALLFAAVLTPLRARVLHFTGRRIIMNYHILNVSDLVPKRSFLCLFDRMGERSRSFCFLPGRSLSFCFFCSSRSRPPGRRRRRSRISAFRRFYPIRSTARAPLCASFSRSARSITAAWGSCSHARTRTRRSAAPIVRFTRRRSSIRRSQPTANLFPLPPGATGRRSR